MSVDFRTMTKEEALTYCERHRSAYLANAAEGGGGAREYDCLVSCVESGHITPSELPDYGMDFEGVSFSALSSGPCWLHAKGPDGPVVLLANFDNRTNKITIVDDGFSVWNAEAQIGRWEIVRVERVRSPTPRM